MKALAALLIMTALSACENKAPVVNSGTTDAGHALDRQAIKAGILPDPENSELAGRFETRGDFGTDKFCAVNESAEEFKIGVFAVSGAAGKCEAQGTATINGDKVRISLQGKGKCEFEAQYDGVELRFPASVEGSCATYCTAPANLSGTHYFMVQNGDDAARRTLGRDIEKLCE